MAEAVCIMYKQVAESIITRCLLLFDSISFVEQQVYYLASDVLKYADCLTPELVAEVTTLHENFNVGKSTLRSKVADTLKAVRSGNKEQRELDDLAVDYLGSDKFYRDIQSKLETSQIVDARKKLDFIKICVDCEVTYVRGDNSIDGI